MLYDVSSSYLEERFCALASFGHNRGGKKNKLHIVYGVLLCAADGCRVAIEIFDGATADPKTRVRQIEKLKRRFGLKRLVVVGDRGMITQARIDDDLKPAGRILLGYGSTVLSRRLPDDRIIVGAGSGILLLRLNRA